MNQHVLLVGGDSASRDDTREYLQACGYTVSELEDTLALQDRLQIERPTLIVLGITKPKLDGINALRALRADGDDIPVILLSARNSVSGRVICLERGADDCLGNPVNPAELAARIRTVLRRCGHPVPVPPYRFGPFEVNFATRELRRDDEPIPLRPSEFATLRLFVNHATAVLTREQISKKLYGNCGAYRNRSLDVSIWRLRRLIETDPSAPRYVQTVWGHGYVFVPHHTK